MEFKGRKVLELEEQIVFRAFDNKRLQPVIVQPAEDETGKLFTGQGRDGYFESISEVDKQSIPFVIDHFTKVSITDGKTLKPTNITDKANWRWLQFSPYIVLDKEKGKSSRTAMYYVENRRAEAEKRISSNKNKDRARYLIQFEFSYEKQLNVARVIGHPSPQGFSPIELTDYLLNQCETIASAILEAADPANAEESSVKVAFHELIRYKVIEKYKGGVFKFGGHDGVFVGHNETNVMKYLSDPKNQETVAAILAQLDDRKSQLTPA